MLFNASAPAKGFTLVEVAIVIVVIGLLLTHSLRPLSSVVEQQRIQRTDQTLEEIKEALLGYAVLNKRLPCPADSAEIGKENIALCGQEGYLPWADLAVGRYDGWGNQFRYRAEKEYTDNPMDYAQVIVNQGATGSGLRVSRYITKEDYDSLPTTQKKAAQWFAATNDSRIAVVIFSCGKNGHPDPIQSLHPENKKSLTSNDADNTLNSDISCNNPKVGVQSREYTYNFQVKDNETILFDDQLTWLSRNTLMNRLSASQRWP